MSYGWDRWLAYLRRKITTFQVAVKLGGSPWHTGKCSWAGDTTFMRPLQEMMIEAETV